MPSYPLTRGENDRGRMPQVEAELQLSDQRTDSEEEETRRGALRNANGKNRQRRVEDDLDREGPCRAERRVVGNALEILAEEQEFWDVPDKRGFPTPSRRAVTGSLAASRRILAR